MSNLISTKTPDSVFKPVTRQQGLSESVISSVIAAILGGQLRAGDRLVVQKLAEQLGVSATPVREGLASLADIGLVAVLPNRGAVCRAFGPQQLREIYQVRRILEVEATRCACDQLDEVKLRQLHRRMIDLIAQQDGDETWSQNAMQADRELHKLIYVACGSERLQHEISRYEVLMQALRRHVGNRLNVQRRALIEHVEVIDSLLERNPAVAAQRIANHIRNTGRDIEKLVFPDEA